MAEHNELGVLGEEIAVDYLKRQGYKILTRNYRHKKEEVDIIAQHNKTLIVIEVKARNSDYHQSPQEAVTKKKQASIIKVANAYIEENEIDLETRFDVIAILITEKEINVEHFEDAFYPLL